MDSRRILELAEKWSAQERWLVALPGIEPGFED
jgi:hypothetical protein